MQIETVRDNLIKTISGKENYLAKLQSRRSHKGDYYALFAVIEMLELNIEELKKILADVEKCIAQTA